VPGVIIAVILSALILAAHFFRSGPGLLVLASLGLIILLFVKRPWVSRVLQVGLWIGAAVMFWTGIGIARERIAAQNPRVVPPLLIMSGVGIFMIVTGLSARGPAARRWFRVAPATRPPESPPPLP
jgi:threonine/homoserine/homoserine lactone efflux protein